jgi:hypothetical protein
MLGICQADDDNFATTLVIFGAVFIVLIFAFACIKKIYFSD